MANARAAQYLKQRYPRPSVDPEWLQGCCEWLTSQPGADPNSQRFLDDVEAQLLQSDLTDSMLEGTGLPVHITQSDHPEANTHLQGNPVLVEIVAMTEIGSSAYQLEQIRAAREERMCLGRTDDDEEGEADLEVEGEGPMPKYPRGMLRFDLSDGATRFNAIEYKSFPELVLGKTELGFKMLLKNTVMQHGIAFLEPNTVKLIGYQTADREVFQRSDFARGLRVRMGLPLEPDEGEAQQPIPPPRAPLREISPPPQPPLNPLYNDDANLEPRRRKLPSTQVSNASSATLVSPNPATDTTTSHYFSNSNNSTSTTLNGFDLGLTTAQASQEPPYNDDDEALFRHFDSIDLFFKAENGLEVDENALPPAPSNAPTAAPGSQTFAIPTTNTTSSPSTSAKMPLSHPLAQEDSVEIISFTPSQNTARSISNTQSRGKGKEKDLQPQSPVSSSSSRAVGASTFDDIGLHPDLLTNLDEVEATRFSDPEFLRKQQEELARLSASVGPKMRTGSLAKGKGKDARPIKPLPKPRHSPASQPRSQSHSSQSQPAQPQSRAINTKSVINILDSDESDVSSPQIIYSRQAPIVDLDDDDDDYREEEYDKENVPVMTRHIRRKVANVEEGAFSGGLFGVVRGDGTRGFTENDVIELSDGD